MEDVGGKVRSKLGSQSSGKSKECAVCGDKALGLNFGAITCESCKAFFRRNALHNKELQCPFDNKCVVDKVTRRFCQRCRLQKCNDIGMKKEYILSREQKLEKRLKIEENRMRKKSLVCGIVDCSGREGLFIQEAGVSSNTGSGTSFPAFNRCDDVSPEAQPHLSPTNSGNSTSSGERAEMDAERYIATGSLASAGRRSDSCSRLFDDAGDKCPHRLVEKHPESEALVQAAQRPRASNPESDLQLLDSVVSIAIKAEFGVSAEGNLQRVFEGNGGDIADYKAVLSKGGNFGCSGAILDPHRSKLQRHELNDREMERLKELYDASRSLFMPMELDKDLHESEAEEPSNLISVINLTDLAIKRIIKMAKQISPFINMCQEDQIALLKGGCTELMILRSLISYNPEKNSWRLPSNKPRELRMDILKQADDYGVQLYEEHQRFLKSFDVRWRSDENVMLLLSAIALFTPERSNVIHKDAVKLEQDTYYFLLRRYLDGVCENGCESRSCYLNLIGRLKDLHRLNESHIQLFLEVDPKCVEPLLIEIFDLKPNNNG